MKNTVLSRFGKLALPALAVGTLMLLGPVGAMAARGGGHGGGGGHAGGGARSFSGGSRGGGISVGHGGYSGGGAYAGSRGYGYAAPDPAIAAITAAEWVFPWVLGLTARIRTAGMPMRQAMLMDRLPCR